MCYKGVTGGKIKKEGKNELKHLHFHLQDTLSLPERLHKFENTGSIRSRKICKRSFHWRERKLTNKGTDMLYVDVFVTQYNTSQSSFVPNFRILSQVVAEKSLTEKCPYV